MASKHSISILVIGHRGAPIEEKECTIPSFKKAIEFGVDGVEMDIQKTKDKRLVVVHNAEFKLPNGEIVYVFEHNYDEIKEFLPDAPLLEEVIDLCKEKVELEIEIKREDWETAELLLDIIAKQQITSSVSITSYHKTILMLIKKINPNIKTGLIFSPFPEWMEDKYIQVAIWDAMGITKSDVAHLNLSLLTPKIVKLLHQQGKLVHAGGVENEEDLKKAQELGVDQFTTNDARRICELLT